MPGIFVIGAVLRVLMLFFQKSFWGDEWASIEVAREPFIQGILTNAMDTHPPLYFSFLGASIRLFGLHEWAMRLPSLAAGILAVGAIYLCTQEMFGKKTALLAAFFSAVSPYMIHLSFEIRNHGLPAFFSTLGTFFFLKMMRDPLNKKWSIGYACAALAAVYTVHFSWFWIGGIWLWHGWHLYKKSAPASTWKVQAWMSILSLPALGLLAFHCFQREELMQIDEHYTLLSILKEALIVYWNMLIGPIFFMHYVKLIVSFAKTSPFFWFCAAFFTSSAWLMAHSAKFFMSNLKEKGFLSFLSAACFLSVAAVAASDPTRLDPRYFAFGAPFLFIFFAEALMRLRKQKMAIVFAGMFTVISLVGDFWMIPLATDPVFRQNYIEMVKYTYTHAGQKEVVCSECHVFEYYKKRYAVPSQASTIQSMEELDRMDVKKIPRVWLLDGIIESSKEYPVLLEQMRRRGFEIEQNIYRFGEEGSSAVVNVFVLRNTSATNA